MNEHFTPKPDEIIDEPDLWFEQESRGLYDYPLPKDDRLYTEGLAIAQLDPVVPREMLVKVGPFLTELSPVSHYEAYNQSIDFLVPEGTDVLAAADGEIIEIVIDNYQSGLTPEFSKFANLITIMHNGYNEEYSRYVHLAQDSLSKGLKIGSKVRRGQIIAKTGQTGWTDRPHLHFMVYKKAEKLLIGDKEIANPYGVKSLKPDFQKGYPLDYNTPIEAYIDKP